MEIDFKVKECIGGYLFEPVSIFAKALTIAIYGIKRNTWHRNVDVGQDTFCRVSKVPLTFEFNTYINKL